MSSGMVLLLAHILSKDDPDHRHIVKAQRVIEASNRINKRNHG
jgi:hypothetical protein